MDKTYYIEYTYTNCWGDTISGRYRAEAQEEVDDYVNHLKRDVQLVSLFLTTVEKII